MTTTVPRTRHDIWRLQPPNGAWHPLILAYAKAVRVMKQNTGTQDRWWQHQTQVHGMTGAPASDDLRNQCQHGSWFFLPWHRLYLYHFERVVRAIIQELPDVADDVKRDWALPYWDYDRDDSRKLPLPFRVATLPDGTANPLFEPSRHAAINSGASDIPAAVSTARGWAHARPYAASVPFGPSFGGPKTGFSHGGSVVGPLENTPHGGVHVTVGGKMADFDTAAGDPIFWLHHANIDRLWEVWRTTTGKGRDETDPAYTSLSFAFLDAGGAKVTEKASAVVDTAGQLGYVYEDIGFPASAGAPRRRRQTIMAAAVEPPAEPPTGVPRRVGALDRTLTLSGGQDATVQVPVDGIARAAAPDVEPAALEVHALGSPSPEPQRRVLLCLEHITAEDATGSIYGVYLDPEGDGDPVHVGNLPLFGLREANRPDAEHELAYVFDVTDEVDDLLDAGDWHPERALVSFRLVGDPELGAPPPTLSIGSISFLVQE